MKSSTAIPPEAAWVCKCGAYSTSPNLNFAMTHPLRGEDHDVMPAEKALLVWGRAFGVIE